MCTVKQVVYVRQQTVQHTPVKLKTLIFNSKKLCECICGDWEGRHEVGPGWQFGKECFHACTYDMVI